MKANSRILHFLAIGQLLIGGAWAQVVDPTTALIGTWEGRADGLKHPDQTLVINSVKPTGSGEWVARGRFGLFGQVDTEKGGGRKLSVSSKDNEILIEFVTFDGKMPVRVKLVGDNKLEGTVEGFDRGKVIKKRIVLEKVAPKAGDVK